MSALVLFFVLSVLVISFVGPVVYMAYVNWATKKMSNEEAYEQGKKIMTGGYVKRPIDDEN